MIDHQLEVDRDKDILDDMTKIYLREGQNPPSVRTMDEVKVLRYKRSRNGTSKYKLKLINPAKVVRDDRFVPIWDDEPNVAYGFIQTTTCFWTGSKTTGGTTVWRGETREVRPTRPENGGW